MHICITSIIQALSIIADSKLSRRDSYDSLEKLDKLKRRDSKKSLLRKYDKSASRLEDDELPQSDDHADEATAEPVTEDYWFICRRWLARSEDDGKIVRELIATDESGNPLEGGLKGKRVNLMDITGPNET